jgi:hypothetical protein
MTIFAGLSGIYRAFGVARPLTYVRGSVTCGLYIY